MTLQFLRLHHKSRDILVGRVGITEFGAHAHFDEEYDDEVAELRKREENRVVFNLGKKEVWWDAERNGRTRRVSLVIGPIVSSTGRPVGVLAALREVHDAGIPWNLEQLKEFEKELASLRDDLFASHLALTRAEGGSTDDP
jgi:hypothetical protein